MSRLLDLDRLTQCRIIRDYIFVVLSSLFALDGYTILRLFGIESYRRLDSCGL